MEVAGSGWRRGETRDGDEGKRFRWLWRGERERGGGRAREGKGKGHVPVEMMRELVGSTWQADTVFNVSFFSWSL